MRMRGTLCGWRRRLHLHHVAGADRVGRRVDDAVVGANAAGELHGGAFVAGDGNSLHRHTIALPDDRDGGAVIAVEDRAAGQGHAVTTALAHREIDLCKGAGLQRAIGIVGLQLDQHGARLRIDRARAARHGRGEGPAGKFRQGEGGGHAIVNLRRGALRHADIDAHPVNIRHREQRLRSGIAGHDERADLRRPAGDDTCERRGQAGEALKRTQPFHIGKGSI